MARCGDVGLVDQTATAKVVQDGLPVSVAEGVDHHAVSLQEERH